MVEFIAALAIILFVGFFGFVVLCIWRGYQQDRDHAQMVDEVKKERGR